MRVVKWDDIDWNLGFATYYIGDLNILYIFSMPHSLKWERIVTFTVRDVVEMAGVVVLVINYNLVTDVLCHMTQENAHDVMLSGKSRWWKRSGPCHISKTSLSQNILLQNIRNPSIYIIYIYVYVYVYLCIYNYHLCNRNIIVEHRNQPQLKGLCVYYLF